MTRRGWLWALLVFGLTLLIELPARWLLAPLPVALQGVSGSLWNGQAQRLGDLGPLTWRWQPWRLQAEASAGYQGQHWQVQVKGWPWAWQASLQPQAAHATQRLGYQLAGQWQGQIAVRGSGVQCVSATGQVQGTALALVAPWQLTLGQAHLRLDCQTGWTLRGQLSEPGQHQAELVAELQARQAKLSGRIEPGSAVQPLLISAQWLTVGGTQVARTIRW